MKRFLTIILLLFSTGVFAQTITEVIYPQLIQGVGSGNAADDRKVPYACRMTVAGLTPNTVYRGYNKFVTDPTLTDNGQGNYIVVDPATGTFTRVTSASLAVAGRYLEFTTDASGSYTGWFISEPTIATTHFQPGTQIYFRLMLNDGLGGSFVNTRITATNFVTVLGFGAGATAGTAIRGAANTALLPKNFVMLYNNVAGTGRPLTGTFIENEGTDNTVANGYAPFYETSVNGISNTWGSIIPNNLANGVNNISQYALSNGGLLNACTAANGVYGSTNTANASGGLTELVITCTPTGGCNISLSAQAANALCNGGSTGSVTLTATGGTTPFNYKNNGGPAQASNIFSGLAAGSYTFTVTDANGCTATTTGTITQPSALAASSTAGTIACNGGSTTVTVSATGGTAPYTGTGTFTRSAGAYTFTVTDANGCTATTTGTITQPAVLAATSQAGTIACNGGSTTVTVSATGGTAPYTGTGSFTRSAGAYTFTVTDARGCTATTTGTITQPAVLTASAVAGTILVSGGTTTVTVSATGGTAPYTGTGSFTRGAGTFSFTVTDSRGCTFTATVTITEPGVLSASSTFGTIACFGGTTTVTVSATGGTAPYTGTGTFTRSAGAYSFTVTDANGATATTTGTIAQPTALVAASTSGTIACNGGSTTVTVTATGGTAPYTGTGTFTRSAGAYTFTVTDANGCTATTTGTITQPTLLAASSLAGTIACNGGSTSVTVSATGGTAPYTGTGSFTRSAGAYTFTVTDARGCTATTTGTITQPTVLAASAVAGTILVSGGTTTVTVTATGGTAPYSGTGTFTRAAGTFSFTVTDANGCTSTATVTINEPGVLSASSTFGTIACFGGTTTVTVTATGGTAPYTGTGTFTRTAGAYSFTVTDANGATATTTGTISQPTALNAASQSGTIACNGGSTTVTVTATGGTAPYTGTGTFTRSAGAYSYTVTDANGCTATTTGTITQPVILAASSSAGVISVPGGSTTVTVSATGGTAPYTGTGSFTRSAGTYTFTVTDSRGCTATTTVTITEPAGNFTASSTFGTIACFAGTTTVTVTATGGTAPYTGTGTFTRGAGAYSYTVTDATGATAVTTGTITQPTALTAASTAGTIPTCGTTTTVTVTATGGTAPYTGTGTFTRGAGAYSYTVTDARGCTATTTGAIAQPTGSSLSATSVAGTIACNGGSTTVTVSATGGTAPYTGTGTFTRGAGAYSYTVTDANGCTSVATGTITQPTVLSATATAGTIPCDGTTTTVTVSATGGTAPYTGTGTFTVSAGAYSYTVTDARGCTKLVSGTIAAAQPCNTGCNYTSSITQNFNSTSISAGKTIWFNSALKLYRCGTATVNITVTNAKITFKRNGVLVTVSVPDSRTSFVYGTSIATTQFTNGKWVTVSPSYTFDRNLFMSGVAYTVPSGGLPGSIKDVKWTADINIDQPGVEIKWKWGAAVYSQFSTNNSALGVKPIDWYLQNYYFNADKAGTPENYKSRLVAGGTGSGGSNYTGNYSSTRTISCGCGYNKESLAEVDYVELPVINMVEVSAMPNPSSNFFKLVIKANSDQGPVVVRVTDISGKQVAIYKDLIPADIKSNSISLQVGETWRNGLYIAEVIQGGQRQAVKLVKMN
ncbi:MAG: T9SS type A sorting domain-containing protein [Ferruginibacter sp.]